MGENTVKPIKIGETSQTIIKRDNSQFEYKGNKTNNDKKKPDKKK